MAETQTPDCWTEPESEEELLYEDGMEVEPSSGESAKGTFGRVQARMASG